MERKLAGCIASKIDGSEHIYYVDTNTPLPESYSYKRDLTGVLDQGNHSICVPCSISANLNWRINLKDGKKRDNNISLFEIYNSRPDNTDGMCFKDAFSFLKKKGVKSNKGRIKISSYAMIVDMASLRGAVVSNGPCFAALPVYSSREDFWNGKDYEKFLGYHAVAIIGYTPEGFILRNSWGKEYGNNGHTIMKYDDFDKMVEKWTIVS